MHVAVNEHGCFVAVGIAALLRAPQCVFYRTLAENDGGKRSQAVAPGAKREGSVLSGGRFDPRGSGLSSRSEVRASGRSRRRPPL